MANQKWTKFVNKFLEERKRYDVTYTLKQAMKDAKVPYRNAKCGRVTTERCPSLQQCKTTIQGKRKSYCRRKSNNPRFKRISETTTVPQNSPASSSFMKMLGMDEAPKKTRTKKTKRRSKKSRRCKTVCETA